MALSIDEVIDGKYKIVRLLGEGGMGAVYEGLNVRIHRRVAIKVLHGNVATNQDAVQRFEREAQAAGRIGSKHIVEVLDLGDLPGGDRYMVMEFLDGQSLADRIVEAGQMTPQELYPIAVQILDGLAAAHAAGIVHRDLKPDNVYLIPQESGPPFAKILDFGISKFNSLGGEFSMTRTGSVMGTPYYMSPEQAKGARNLDQRTDLYAVGVILYEALTGRVPFNAETFNELLFKIVLEEAPDLNVVLPGVNPAFVEIVRMSMAREPNDRYQTAGDFKAALSLWSQRNSVAPLGIEEPTRHFGATPPTRTVTQGTVTHATAGAWSQNDAAATPPKKNFIALGVAAALVLAAGGVAVKLALREPEEAEALAPSAASAPEETKPATVAPVPAAPVAAPPAAAAPAAAPQPEEAPAAETKKPSAKPAAVSAAKPKPAAPAPTEKKPEPAAPTQPSSSTSTGRTIRTSL